MSFKSWGCVAINAHRGYFSVLGINNKRPPKTIHPILIGSKSTVQYSPRAILTQEYSSDEREEPRIEKRNFINKYSVLPDGPSMQILKMKDDGWSNVVLRDTDRLQTYAENKKSLIRTVGCTLPGRLRG